MYAKACKCNLWCYTFVRKLHKSMITEIFLTKDQVEEINFNLVGRKVKELLVQQCVMKRICGRSTAYNALDGEEYDGENALHRLVANEAVVFLKKTFDVTFPWAEIEVQPIEA